MRFIFLPLIFPFVDSVAIYGLMPNTLVKLSDTEKADIMAKCGHPAENKSGKHGSTDRIVNGNDAHKGQFPFAAFIEFLDEVEGEPVMRICGATLISWRHAVTAQHCMILMRNNETVNPHDIHFWIGGVCREPDPDLPSADMCIDQPYMERLNVDNVFFVPSRDEDGDIPTEDDHAIIQLSEAVAMDLRQSGPVDFACLPRRNEPLPATLNAWGWGSTNFAPASDESINLHYVATTTTNQIEGCNVDSIALFCAQGADPANPHAGTSTGDSGGGAVDLQGRLHGIHSMAGWRMLPNIGVRYISVDVRVGMKLDFYCEHLDLCMPQL